MDEKDKIIAELRGTIVLLREEIDALKRRLDLDSSNSSKPPSNDGLNKPSPKSQRQSLKGFGGQKGHKGKTLERIEHPDAIVQIPVSHCEVCQAFLNSAGLVVKRQVFEVEIKRKVTEYQAEVNVCTCGKRNVGKFPQQIKASAQYGNSVKSLGLYLMQHFIPKERCAQLFNDLFHIPISDTTLMNFEEECANNLIDTYKFLRETLEKSPLKHLDESGLSVKKKLHWLHVLSNKLMTYYHVDAKRGYSWEGLSGTIVHDHWKSYFSLNSVKHALCNAHHLRELQAVADLDKEPWAKTMSELLLEALKSPENHAEIATRYDELIQQGLAFHEKKPLPNHKNRKNARKRKGHNLLIRLRDYKTETLRFMYEDGVPFTNNQAEQDIRMVKVKQKVSGCFRSERGAKEFAMIRSFISTLRKQKMNLWENINLACKETYLPKRLCPTI